MALPLSAGRIINAGGLAIFNVPIILILASCTCFPIAFLKPSSTDATIYVQECIMKKDTLGWLNASLQSAETRDELSTTLYLQSKKIMSRWTVRILVLVTKSKYSIYFMF